MLTPLFVALVLSPSARAEGAVRKLLSCGSVYVNFQGVGQRLVVDGRPVEVEWSDEGRDALFVGGAEGENAQHHFEILPGGGYQLDGVDCGEAGQAH